MLKAPENVRERNGFLAWDAVPCADGYNVHSGEEYRATVSQTEFRIEECGEWSVSAFLKTDNGDSAHTKRSAAVLICPDFQPSHIQRPEFVDQLSLIFDDEFVNGVDANNWRTELLWGDELIINQEEQVYVDTQNGNDPPFDTLASPFSITPAGDLGITARPLSAALQAQTDRRFSSGKICAIDRAFKYGFVEFCVKVPCSGEGTWLGFWLLNRTYYDNAFQKNQAEGNVNGNDKFNFEADFELVYGPGFSGPDCVKNALHYFTGDRNDQTNYDLWTLDSGGFRQVEAHPQSGGNLVSQFNVYPDCSGNQALTLPDECKSFCDDFHTFAFHWEPEFVHFYVDGVLVNCVNDRSLVPDQAMYPILNYAVGGTFPYGNPPQQFAPQNEFPQTLEVRHVKIWQ